MKDSKRQPLDPKGSFAVKFLGEHLEINDADSTYTGLLRESAKKKGDNKALSVFPDKRCLPPKRHHYINRRLDHYAMILSEIEDCPRIFREKMLLLNNIPAYKQIWAFSISKRMKEIRSFRCNKQMAGHENCRNLVKASDLINNLKECKRNKVKIARCLQAIFREQGSTEMLYFVEMDGVYPEKQFAELETFKMHFVCHWFHTAQCGFMWKRSFGRHASLEFLNPIFKPMQIDEGKLFDYVNIKGMQNIILISAVAGMGKTHFLTTLAHHIKSNRHRKLVLVLFLDLERVDKIFHTDRLLQNQNRLDHLLFLLTLRSYFRFRLPVEWLTLRHLLLRPPASSKNDEPELELLMDGVDRMSNRGRKLLLDYLKTNLAPTQKRNYRVWLTTRPHLEKSLEKKLNIIAYTLDPFSKQEIKQFLSRRNKVSEDTLQAIFRPFWLNNIQINLQKLLAIPQRLIVLEQQMMRGRLLGIVNVNPINAMKIVFENLQYCYVENYLSNMDQETINCRMKALLGKHVDAAVKYMDMMNIMGECLDKRCARDLMDFGLVIKKANGQLAFVRPIWATYLATEMLIHDGGTYDRLLKEFYLHTFHLRDTEDDSDADLEEPSGLVSHPFHFACIMGYLPLVKILLEQGVNINERNEEGYTALIPAVLHDQAEVVDYLLKAGIDKSDFDKEYEGYSLWHYVCSNNLTKMVRFFIFKLDLYSTLNHPAENGLTALHVAAQAGCAETTRLLLKYGANMEIEDKDGITPLLLACRHLPKNYNPDVITLLLQYGANCNACDKTNHHGILHTAAMFDNVELARRILKLDDFNLDWKSQTNNTPLHLACKNGACVEMIKCLIKEGKADVNAVNGKRETPLISFANSKNLDPNVGICLIQHGADPYYKGSGVTPMQMVKRKSKQVYKQLKRCFKEKMKEDSEANDLLDILSN